MLCFAYQRSWVQSLEAPPVVERDEEQVARKGLHLRKGLLLLPRFTASGNREGWAKGHKSLHGSYHVKVPRTTQPCQTRFPGGDGTGTRRHTPCPERPLTPRPLSKTDRAPLQLRAWPSKELTPSFPGGACHGPLWSEQPMYGLESRPIFHTWLPSRATLELQLPSCTIAPVNSSLIFMWPGFSFSFFFFPCPHESQCK